MMSVFIFCVGTCARAREWDAGERQKERKEERTNKVDADGGHVGLAELVVLWDEGKGRDERTGNGRSTRGAEVVVGGGAGANDKAEEETRLADTRLADDEELEEQVRSGEGGESGRGGSHMKHAGAQGW